MDYRKKLATDLQQQLNKTSYSLYVTLSEDMFQLSNDLNLGDVYFDCTALSKKLPFSPADIAKNAVSLFQKPDYVKEINTRYNLIYFKFA